jgi:hypothetical protein
MTEIHTKLQLEKDTSKEKWNYFMDRFTEANTEEQVEMLDSIEFKTDLKNPQRIEEFLGLKITQ